MEKDKFINKEKKTFYCVIIELIKVIYMRKNSYFLYIFFNIYNELSTEIV